MMKGPIRTTRISKRVNRVNILSEPTDIQINKGSRFSAVLAYTYVSPGLSRARVMLKNLTAQPVMVDQGQTVAAIKPGNEVPKMLVLKINNIKNESGPEVDP